jgi:hypothetical protein
MTQKPFVAGDKMRFFPLILTLLLLGTVALATLSPGGNKYACRDYCKLIRENGGVQDVEGCQKCCRERVGTKDCEESCARGGFRPVPCEQYGQVR